MIKNQLDDHIIQCGQFKLHMYGDLLLAVGFGKKELREQTQKLTRACPFEIVTRTDEESLKFVDVSYLQTLKENRNAVFQIATNFNAVNGINETAAPDRDRFTESYHFDKTQGPIASISAGGGAIVRVHAPFFNSKKPSSTWCQNSQHQMNFVSEKKLSKHFPVQNGYVVYTGAEPKFPKEDSKDYKKLLSSYFIAYHRNQQVVYGRCISPTQIELVQDPEQRVDHVCCAAVNMLQRATGINNKGIDAKRTKMEFILQAVYNSAYLSAIYNQREKLFLTLVGGGAFGNEFPAIFKAIHNAHVQWSKHTQCKLKKVVLVLFGQNKEVPQFMQALANSNVSVSYLIYEKGVPKGQTVPTKNDIQKK